MNTIESLKNEISSIENAIHELRLQINSKKRLIKEECLKEADVVEGLAKYIKAIKYPTELYSCFGSDWGDRDSFGDIKIKVCRNYGYTDVVGLTEEQFEKLQDLLFEEE